MGDIVRHFPAHDNSRLILFQDMWDVANGTQLKSVADVIEDRWIGDTSCVFTSLKQFRKGDGVREYMFAMIVLEHIPLTSQPPYVGSEKGVLVILALSNTPSIHDQDNVFCSRQCRRCKVQAAATVKNSVQKRPAVHNEDTR